MIDLACHLLDYPISRSSPYKKSAIDTLAQAAELGLGRAAEKLAVIYSAEPVTKETLAKAYYWQHVAAELSRQAASSVGISDLAGLLSAEERALAIDMASRFRVVASDPIQSLVRNTSPGNVGRAAPTRHRGGRHSARRDLIGSQMGT
nr:hypothetical protein [Yoonia sp.]